MHQLTVTMTSVTTATVFVLISLNYLKHQCWVPSLHFHVIFKHDDAVEYFQRWSQLDFQHFDYVCLRQQKERFSIHLLKITKIETVKSTQVSVRLFAGLFSFCDTSTKNCQIYNRIQLCSTHPLYHCRSISSSFQKFSFITSFYIAMTTNSSECNKGVKLQ